MRAEQEIAAFAFPFAAGVSAAVVLGASPCIINPTYPIFALTATLLSAALLLHSSRNDWSSVIQWAIVGSCAISCGIFIGLSASELKVSEIAVDGALSRYARTAGGQLQSLIDRIAFADRSTNAVLKALLTGERSDIPSEITRAFRDSGASHILALSGLHLGVIYAIISKGLSLAGNSIGMRRLRSIMAIILCGLYTLATGAGASITRAYVFIIVKEAAEMAGRHTSLKSILALSLMLHLAVDPTAAMDVGFQLSYAAISGIAYIFPHLRNIWKNNWKTLKWVWDSAALSISCQLTTGPLAYYYFGTFPQYFLLTNLIAIPLSGMIIPAALLTAALTAIDCCPNVIIWITEWLTQTLIRALSVIASI